MKVIGKRGQGLSLSTIILLVLGVVVLVFLIFGFSSGWSNLWGKVSGFTGGSANLDTTAQACELACLGMQESAFCVEVREVKYGKKIGAWTIDEAATVADKSAAPTTITALAKDAKVRDGNIYKKEASIKKSEATCMIMAEDTGHTNFPGLKVDTCQGLC